MVEPDPDQRGFALALVVLLLFAISMLGAAGYQILRTEASQAQQYAELTQALAVADAGLRWYTGSQRGTVRDSTTYNINGGTAVITTRKVATLSEEEDLYLVSSEGVYTDPRLPQIPARRTVSQYAIYEKIPLRNLAPFMTTSDTVRVRDYARVYAVDQALPGECAGAPAGPLAGVLAVRAAVASGGGVISGSPAALPSGTFQAAVDTVGFDWSIFSDPTFPVDYDGTWPNFWSLPADSFPVVRVNGDLSASWSRWGRGVLIVTGRLRIPDLSFWHWNGIVVAGAIDNVATWGWFDLRGTLVGGLGAPMGILVLARGNLYAHSCYVERAGLSLAHLTPLGNSWWEAL